MLLSMTGYGQGSLTDQQLTYMLEIRSVNNRYFKAVIKVPEQLGCHEPAIERLLRERLNRGSVVYLLKLRDVSPKAAYEINHAALLAYAHAAEEAASKLNPGSCTVDLGALMDLPGVCHPIEQHVLLPLNQHQLMLWCKHGHAIHGAMMHKRGVRSSDSLATQ